MNKKIEVQKIKLRLGEFLNDGKCFVCGKTKTRSGFVIHHLSYIFDDVTYNKYPKNMDGQLRYYKDLEKVVMEDPKRFLYVCNKHHQAIERLNRYKKENLLRLILAVKLTKTK